LASNRLYSVGNTEKYITHGILLRRDKQQGKTPGTPTASGWIANIDGDGEEKSDRKMCVESNRRKYKISV